MVDSNVATVTITVTASNDAPTASNDSYSVAEDNSLVVTAPGVLSNHLQDASPISAVLVRGANHGEVTLELDGSFAYTPQANNHVPVRPRRSAARRS